MEQEQKTEDGGQRTAGAAVSASGAISGTALKACPFCGGGNVLMCGALGNHHVQCYGCGATTAKFRYMARAAGAWNRRNNVSAERAEFAQIISGLLSRGTITQADVERLEKKTIQNSESKIMNSGSEVAHG